MRLILIALAVSVLASVAMAQTYAMGLTAPTSGFVAAGYTYNMGYSFSTTQSNVQVTHLAGCTSNTAALTVCLWDTTAPGSPIRQVTTGTSSAGGQWRTAALGSPLTLVANRQYRVSTSCISNGYYFNNVSAGPFHPTGTINYNAGCYDGGASSPAYPGNDDFNYLYGIADIGYSTGPGLTVTATAGSAQSVVATDTGPSATGRNIGTYTVTANSSGACTLNSMTITASGTGNDNNAFSEVGIYEDTNATTAYDAGDVRYGAASVVYPSDNGAITFTAAAAFAANQTRRYFVVVKLNGSTLATNGQTFNSQVSAISVTSGSAGGTPSTVMNGIIITGPVLTVSATAGTASTVYADSLGSGSIGIQAGLFTITNSAVASAQLNSITVVASGSGNDSNAYSEVGLFEDTNSSGAYDAADTRYGAVSTAFPADNGTIVFSGTQTFATSQMRRYFVVVKLNGSTLATPAQTFNSQVNTIAVGSGVGIAGTPSTVMNGITIQAPTFTYTDASPGSAATAYPSSTDFLLQKFSLNYAAGPANSVTGITLGAQGSGNDLTGYASVKLYRDSNTNGTYDVGVDTLLNSQSAFSADNGTLTFTVTENFTVGGTATYFVVAAFGSTVTTGQTFQCRITAGSYGYTGTTSTNLPAPSGFTAGLTISQPSYVVTNTSPASQGTAYLGGSNYILQGFSIAYPSGPTNTLTGITLTASGTGNDQTNYSSVQLYRDNNGNSTYDVGTDTLVASQTSFATDDGTLSFTLGGTESVFAASTTKLYFIVVGYNLTGTNSTTFRSQLTNITGTSFGATLTGVPCPATSGSPGLLLLANNLVATLNGPGTVTTVNSTDQGPGGNGLLLCDITLQTINGAWTVSNLTFTASGGGNDATAYNFLALYDDANSNGTFDGPSGGDTLAVASAGTAFSANDGPYVATLVNTTVAASSSRRFFLVGKLAGTAVTGNTFNAALTAASTTPPAGGQLVGVPTSNSTALIVGASALSITLGPAAAPATTVEGGTAFGYTLAEFRFTASNNNVTVNGITLTTSGSGSWVTHLATPGIELYLDNGNGTYDGAALDTLLYSGAGNVPTLNCTFIAPLNITNASAKDIWVRVNFAANAGASIPETYRGVIAAASDVNVTGATPLLGTPAPNSALCSVVLFNVTSMTPVFDQPAGGSNITLQGSGFLIPLTLTINGAICPGTPVINANGTQVTGLRVPAGTGQNLVIVLNDGSLGAKTLTQTFSYAGSGTIGNSSSSSSGGGSCTTDNTTSIWFAALAFLALTTKLALRRRQA